jgi:hypothetical protein
LGSTFFLGYVTLRLWSVFSWPIAKHLRVCNSYARQGIRTDRLNESDRQVIIAGHDGVAEHHEDSGKAEAFSRDILKFRQDMLPALLEDALRVWFF